MRLKFLLSFLLVALLVAACFLPWMAIESKDIRITGVDTSGTRFAKPAYFHFLWGGLYLLFLLFNKVWAIRTAIVLAAFNIAWALRNFLLIPACQMGECPIRESGLYLVLITSLLMIITPMFSTPSSLNKKADA